MTVDDQPRYRAAAIVAGAAGFISKSDHATQLPILIRQLLPDCGPDPGNDPS
jgi:DNA-binding NarL/FixJ family response regulator